MESQMNWIFLLAGTLTFIGIFMEIVVRVRPFQQVIRRQAGWLPQVILVLMFGGFSILGTYMGVKLPSGAIINVRDLGPMVAGLMGGPLLGLGAGLIGGVHRYFMGGFTAIPCALATVLAGLICGAIYVRRGGKLVGIHQGVLIAVLVECLHMALALLIARPFDAAVETVKIVVFPMVLSNAVGVAVSILFIADRLQREKVT